MNSFTPLSLEFLFIACTLYTLYCFYRATNKSNLALALSLGWIIIQGIIAYSLYYTKTDSIPPRFILAILPFFLLIIILFTTKKGRLFIDNLNNHFLILVHIVRVPIEFGLYYLFIHKQIPEIMTFSGANFDIIAGLTAPIIYFLRFFKPTTNKTLLISWNILMLGLLLNIIAIAILSAPTPFQQFAFEQPNMGVLYFPFIWLPAFIVPVVSLSHLADIRKLALNKA